MDIRWICIAEEEGKITAVAFYEEWMQPKDVAIEETALIRSAAQQLREYFVGQRKHFTLPIAPRGTLFQERVWQALLKIPYGQTRSYGEIAHSIGAPKASRAVGMANHKNPVAIIIPCHRVIGANGKLTGYAGGLALKDQLLRLERSYVNQLD